jgi:uncharacterized protein with von Willebrand factor type A (vWA) domain
MRKRFNNADDVLGSDIFSWLQPPKPQGIDNVLKSTKLENAIFGDLHDDELAAMEASAEERLATFKSLSQDAFQSMYSLNPKKNEESELSTMARKFNLHIVNEMMSGDTYPTLKALCEGRELPAFEAAKEFVENILSRLDDLLEAAGGEKKSLDLLEKLENQQEQTIKDLNSLLEQKQHAGGQNNPEVDKKLTALANKADSKAKQIAALNQMVDHNLRKNKAEIQAAIQAAAQSAQDKVQEVSDILACWGDEAGNPMGKTPANQDLLDKVRGNKNLLDIAKYLGRFREILTALRKNSYAYGRGEKYSIELGRDLQRVITSEFAMLASPETVPLFLRKYQQKSLKQYQRREAVCKGHGDIICCLDESYSTKGEPAAWGKALAFSLLEVAKINKRNFALIHFSGEGSVKVDVFNSSKYTLDDVIASADTFLGGGTDYETPLTEALRLIQDGFQNADVVFITDGECAVSDDFAENFRNKKAEHKFTVTGLLLDKDSPGFEFSLESFCEKVYRTSEILEGDVVRSVLGNSI